MATPKKFGDKYRIQIDVRGTRKSAVRDTKRECNDWAARETAALIAVTRGEFPKRTMAEAVAEYLAKVSTKKEGTQFETYRLTAFMRDFPEIACKQLSQVTTADMAGWRDRRLEQVSPSTVLRELNIISNLFTVARKEWGWCGASPTSNLKAPRPGPARERLPTRSEVRRILRRLGYRTDERPTTKSAEVGFAFLLALHTGMRAGELLQLCPDTVQGNVAVVEHKMQYKTGKPRRVPLSEHAVRLLATFKGFTVSAASLDALFRKATRSLLIDDLHFHDSRASALTRLSSKVDVLELARVSGHADLRVLNEVYYRKSSEAIGLRL